MGDDLNTNTQNTTLELINKIESEVNINSTKDLVAQFNWNMAKKNALRILKLSGLLDSITDQMVERFNKRPGEFSNRDLLDYLQAVQNTLEKSTKALSQVDEAPHIMVQNNTQVNISAVDKFDQESRDRIANALKTVITSIKNTDVIEGESTDAN